MVSLMRCVAAEAYEDPREPRFRESQPGISRLSTRVPEGATQKFIHIKNFMIGPKEDMDVQGCRGI